MMGLKTPNMIAFGTMIAPNFILTNRNVVEDHAVIAVRMASGDIRSARPTLHVVAFDRRRSQTWVNNPSSYANFPNLGVNPQARVHSDAEALPGNSGGAVVDEVGRLVGILAAGGGGMSEVIPNSHLSALLKSSRDEASVGHAELFFRQGKAISDCADLLYVAGPIARNLPADLLQALETACLVSENRMLFDLAGQKFGQWWMIAKSKMFLLKSLGSTLTARTV